MVREVSIKTLSNVNIRDPSHDKNLPINIYIRSFNFYPNVVNLTNLFFSVQERLTKQIATALNEAIGPTGVGVIIDCWYVSYFFFSFFFIGFNFARFAFLLFF